MNRKIYIALLMLCSYLLPAYSHAYVGPGAGLSAIGAILAFIGAILLLIVGFFWYPIKRILKRKKDDVQQITGNEDGESNPGAKALGQESKLIEK